MSKFLKGIIFAIGAVTALSVSAAAKNSKENIDVAYNNIKIYTDGIEANTSDAEPFIYNGTVYMPIRSAAEALGVNVDWDGNTKSVYLTSKDSDFVRYYEDVADDYDFDLAGHYTGSLGYELSISIYSTRPSNSDEIGNADFTFSDGSVKHGEILKVDSNTYILQVGKPLTLTKSVENGVIHLKLDNYLDQNLDVLVMDKHYEAP